MKKFAFRLETVLKLKEKALDDKMLEMAKITKILQEEEEKLNNLINKKANINDHLISIYQSRECLDLQEVHNHKEYLIQLAVNITNKENLLKQINAALKEKQMEVQEALKEKNILEKLKEKQAEKHYVEIMQKQMTELDDITISRYKAV